MLDLWSTVIIPFRIWCHRACSRFKAKYHVNKSSICCRWCDLVMIYTQALGHFWVRCDINFESDTIRMGSSVCRCVPRTVINRSCQSIFSHQLDMRDERGVFGYVRFVVQFGGFCDHRAKGTFRSNCRHRWGTIVTICMMISYYYTC